MHQTHLLGVADRRPAGLGVFDDVERHAGVGGFVDVDVADAGSGLDAGNLRLLDARADQPRAAARDQQVDQTDGGHQLDGAGAARVLHQPDQTGGQSGVLKPRAQRADDGARRAEGLLAAAQHAGIAALDAQRGGVAGDVGPALVDDGDHAQRHAGLFDHQPVGALDAPDHAPDRIAERGDLPDAIGHAPHAVGRQPEAVDHHIGDVSARGGDVQLVGGQNVRLAGQQPGGHGFERGVLRRSVRRGEARPRRAGALKDFPRSHMRFLPIKRVPTGSPSSMR